jgi:cellulose synthase/poly-beta-1,6-N-acetylglucosamine synthase-like glycosyltransferase
MTWDRLPNAAIDLARNVLALNFLNDPEKSEYLLFIDNDCTWHADAIMRLVNFNLPVVCAMMFTREIPPTPTPGKLLGQTKSGKFIYDWGMTARKVIEVARAHSLDHKNVKDNAVVLNDWETDKYLWEIDGCGMHFTLIRRDVIEAVGEPWFVMSRRYGAGEDYHFCQRVKEKGFPIYVDLGNYTGHSTGEENDVGLRELLGWCRYENPEDIKTETGTWEVEGWK